MNFVANEYPDVSDMDNLLVMLKQSNLDPYNLLNGYAAYLSNHNVSTLTLKQRVVTIKNFFEYSDIDISPRRFKLKVKLPKVVRKRKKHYQKKILLKYSMFVTTFA
jgi:hypothetical protein